MTEQELAEIEARYRASTPGEWFPGDYYWDLYAKSAGENTIDNPVTGICTLLDGEYNFNSNCDNDGKFIQYAHNTDIPALLAEVRRLREMLGVKESE